MAPTLASQQPAAETNIGKVPNKEKVNDPFFDPVGCIWRGDLAGKVKHETIPDFGNDLQAKRTWIKEHMAAAFRYWGKIGFGEGAAGHITVHDPILEGHYWMNPFGVHFSRMTASKLVLVDPSGHVSPHGAQLPINGAGFFIHSSIHKARPDVQAVGHCHTLNAKAWSAFGRPIDLLTQDSCIFYQNLSVYENFGGAVLAFDEGQNIAKAIGPTNRCVILQNHGLLTLGTTVDEVAYTLSLLEKECKVQLMAEAATASGITKKPIGDEEAAYTHATVAHPENLYVNFRSEYDLLVDETNGAFLK